MKEAHDGIRKLCGCPKGKWKACKDPWYFSYQWKGTAYRFNLNRHLGRSKHDLSKGEAERTAEEIRIAIRNGTFGAVVEKEEKPQADDGLTFEHWAEHWKKEKGYQLVRPEDNDSRIKTISNHRLPSGERFGDRDVLKITSTDIEHLRTARRAAGRSVVTINHDLKLLRKMWNWGIRARVEAECGGHAAQVYGLTSTPFRVGGITLISLEKETPRNERFTSDEDEERLLALADARMKAFIVTMLDTACRPGELKSLQWRQVNLKGKLMTVLPGKCKTKVGRRVRLTARVVELLEARRCLPDGERMPPDAYVFGNEVGEEMTKDVLRNGWDRLKALAKQRAEDTDGKEGVDLNSLHLADLRHEAASRFDDEDIPTAQISKLLGHANVSTTSRYVNPSEQTLRRAVDKIEERHVRLANSLQKPQAARVESVYPADKSLPVSIAESTV